VELETTIDIDPAIADPIEDAIPADDLVEDELLVEEISIDGMCGVY
jgi:mycofactocin precursor